MFFQEQDPLCQLMISLPLLGQKVFPTLSENRSGFLHHLWRWRQPFSHHHTVSWALKFKICRTSVLTCITSSSEHHGVKRVTFWRTLRAPESISWSPPELLCITSSLGIRKVTFGTFWPLRYESYLYRSWCVFISPFFPFFFGSDTQQTSRATSRIVHSSKGHPANWDSEYYYICFRHRVYSDRKSVV